MKTLEEIKALSYEEKEKLERKVLKAIDDNDLAKVKDILKDYPAEISFYGEKIFKYKKQVGENSIIVKSPLLDPYPIILKAALICEKNDNDFSILNYLFNEYGLSLKDPMSNFPFYEAYRIIKADENIIITEKHTEALLSSYLEEVYEPNLEVIKFLVSKGARFDIYDNEYGNSILHTTSYKKLEVCVKAGADINMKAIGPWYDDTVLNRITSVRDISSYVIEDYVEEAKFLIKFGADVNCFITPRHTILDLAYHSRMKGLLIDSGALTYKELCEKNNLESAKMSLEDLKSISLITRDHLVEKLNDLVASNDIEGVKDFLKDYPIPEVFFEKCFNVIRDRKELGYFFNPAHILGYAGLAYDKSKSFAMIEYLESLGLQADYQYLGGNALTMYIDRGGKNPKTIEYFKSKGATFEIYDQFGATPLHRWAKDNRDAKKLEVALKAGVNPNIKRGKRSDGEVDWSSIDSTPLYEATRYDEGKPKGACVEVLLKYGAEVNAVCYYLDEETGTWYKIRSVLDGDLKGSKHKPRLREAGAKSWKQLVKEYNIDTSLELKEQYRIYNELLEKKGK